MQRSVDTRYRRHTDGYSENDFDQKSGILTKLTKKIWNFENFENFEKMRHSLARQSLAKDCT